jgi:hypothetical protein
MTIVFMIKVGIKFSGADIINSIILISSMIILFFLSGIVGYFYFNDFFLIDRY